MSNNSNSNTPRGSGKKLFTYCKGKGCAIKEGCTRYTEGTRIDPDAEGYWWMEACGYMRAACTPKSQSELLNHRNHQHGGEGVGGGGSGTAE